MSSEAEAKMPPPTSPTAPAPSEPAAKTPTVTVKPKKRSSSARKKKPTPKAATPENKQKTPAGSKVEEVEMLVPGQSPEVKPQLPVLETATDASPKKAAKKTMTEMVHEAIKALKDRTGSSQIAIQKYILGTWPQDENNTFRSRLSQALKKGIKGGHFAKVKASFKISSEWTKKEKARHSKEAVRKAAEKKKRDQVSQTKKHEDEAKRIEAMSASLSQEELDELKHKHELKVERQRQKDEVVRKAKEKLERLKRRRFPMEDTRLHEEDKELGISSNVKRRPAIPYFFQIARDSKTTSQTPSRCDAMDVDTRGLVPDLLQIYHFFRGDVRFCDLTGKKLVCDFSLSHLIYAVDEVLMGNARKSKLVPPLLQHLFLCCLSLLTAPVHDGETKEQAQLSKDLEELSEALNPASWSEICIMYMECMDRYYKSPASQDPSVLQPGVTDVSYLFRVTQTPDLTSSPKDIPDGYFGYFGNPKSALARAFDKLNRQDVWTLQAEELLALLRALTDDVMATRPDIMVEISDREEELAALVRDKRAADSNFRKVKLALEGPPPKKPAPKKKDDKEDKKKDDKDENKESDVTKEKPFKATATKKQLDQARKDQGRANEAYEKGLRTLVARTEHFAHDRHFNRYYCFSHDPEFIFVEMNRSVTGMADHLPTEVQINRTSWHAIDKVSILDIFASSLDVRGYREKALHDELMGTEDAPRGALKKFMYDDVKESNAIAGRHQERKEVQQKLKEVKLNILRLEDDEGRRPSRFQTDQVGELESQIAVIDNKIAASSTPDIPDYAQLTGLNVLRKFDNKTKRYTRRTNSDSVAPMPCTSLIPSGNEGSGVVGWIVDEMLNVEKLCQDLVPWEAQEKRNRWIKEIEKDAAAWNEVCPLVLGPDTKDSPVKESYSSEGVLAMASMASPVGRQSIDSVGTARRSIDGGKRRRVDSPALVASASSQVSLHHIITHLKQPLLDLEKRIYQVSGLAMADRDQNIADDNMSAADEPETTEEHLERERFKKRMAWRKKVHLIRITPAKRPGQLREALVQAIAAARKAHLGQIVAQLRSALLLYHSDAAGNCKKAAIAVLDEHGGYNPDDDDDDDDEGKSGDDEEDDEPPVPSNLCFEAVSLLGSLGDDDKATRVDWTDAVQQCKTITRFAALSTAFCRKATSILEKLLSERQSLEKALAKWQREEDTKKRPGKKQNRKVVEAPTEMWANVDYTNEFCMVRLDNHPWWPAKKCIAQDASLQESLQSFDRVLVAMVGEHGELRCVKSEDARVFTGSAMDEDLEQFSKDDRSQLEESLAIARRIIRGRKKKPDEDQDYVEEKKTAS